MISMVFLLITIGCQQGKKVDSTVAFTYEESLKRSDEIASELAQLGISLDPSAPEEKSLESLDTESIQEKLENYIIVSNKLLVAADTRYVQFPEKVRVQNGVQRASKLLGRIYSQKTWDGRDNTVQTRDVEYAEFEARLKIVSDGLNYFKSLNIHISDSTGHLERLRKLPIKEVKQVEKVSNQLSREFLRMKVLTARNNAFDLKGLESFSVYGEQMGGFYWNLGQSAQQEIQSRTKASPSRAR